VAGRLAHSSKEEGGAFCGRQTARIGECDECLLNLELEYAWVDLHTASEPCSQLGVAGV